MTEEEPIELDGRELKKYLEFVIREVKKDNKETGDLFELRRTPSHGKSSHHLLSDLMTDFEKDMQLVAQELSSLFSHPPFSPTIIALLATSVSNSS